MVVKVEPKSLFDISTLVVVNYLLKAWLSQPDNLPNSESYLKDIFRQHFPFRVVDKIFYLLIETHARTIQTSQNKENLPSITCLISSSIVPHLRILNLNYLRHLGAAHDEEIQYMQHVLLQEIPVLNNLVELYLQTGGQDITLPICGNEILEKVGEYCPNLRTLDVSYNSTVTDDGLECLIPADNWQGCPLLEKIFVFECSVSSEGVSQLLKGLTNLKTLGYKETCLSLLNVYKQNFKTKLDHINNLGTICRTFKEFRQFRCTTKMTVMLKKMCPELKALKVRVVDSDVLSLQLLKGLTVLELVYNIGMPSSPGSGTEQFLKICGGQLVSLSLVSADFSTEYLKIICNNCDNLQRLWIKCYKFIYTEGLYMDKSALSNLKLFSLTVGDKYVNDGICNVPYNVFEYVLKRTTCLEELIIAMKNTQLNDKYINNLLNSIHLKALKYLSILTPDKNITRSSLNISMNSVEKIINLCPKLIKLSNLLVWNVDFEDVQEFRKQLKSNNNALNIIYKYMIV